MRRAAVILWGLALASLLSAQTTNSQTTVYLSATAKTYHARRDCPILARSRKVLISTDLKAKEHGLKAHDCAKSVLNHGKPSNAAWAEKEAK